MKRQIYQHEQRDNEDRKGDKAQRLRLHPDLHVAPDERGDLIDLFFVAILAGKAAVTFRAAGHAQSALAMFAQADRIGIRVVEAFQVGRPTNRNMKVRLGAALLQ